MNLPQRLSLKHAAVAVVAPLVAGLIACGCAVDQKKEVATYRTVIDGPKPLKIDYQPGDPLPLEACLLLANQRDEQLASSGEAYLQALIDKERQFAAFLPTLSLAPAFNWQSNRTSTKAFPAPRQGNTDVPAVANYNVFNGFQDVANYRRAGYTAQEQKALLQDLQQTILLNAAQTYYAVLTSERSVTVLLNSNSVQNERIRDMVGQEKAGLARPLDVAQTEATAAATRVQLIQAQNNVRTGRIALAFLCSAPVQDAPLADRVNVPWDLPSADDALDLAVRTRQDVQAGEAAVEAARQNVQAALGQYYPSISLNLDYYLRKASADPTQWMGVLQANIPIFSAGVIDANVRTAWSQLRQAWLNDQRLHRQVAEQVRTARENLYGSRKRIVDLKVEVRAARDALQVSQFSYQAGLATNLDVLTATDTLLSAQLGLVTERLNFKVYYLQLLRSEGRLARPDSLPSTTAPSSQPADEELTTPDFLRQAANAKPAAMGNAPAAATEPAAAPAPASMPASNP